HQGEDDRQHDLARKEQRGEDHEAENPRQDDGLGILRQRHVQGLRRQLGGSLIDRYTHFPLIPTAAPASRVAISVEPLCSFTRRVASAKSNPGATASRGGVRRGLSAYRIRRYAARPRARSVPATTSGAPAAPIRGVREIHKAARAHARAAMTDPAMAAMHAMRKTVWPRSALLTSTQARASLTRSAI